VHRPGRLEVGQLRGPAGRHQPVVAALQHDAGDPDGRDERPVAGRPGHQQGEGAGRLQERRVGVRVEAALAGHLDRELADLGRHADGSAQVSSRVACTNASAPSRARRRASDRSATPGHGEQRHLPGQRPAGQGGARQRGPDQGQPATDAGCAARAAATARRPWSCRAARRAVVDGSRKRPAARSWPDRRRAPGPRGAAVPGQVDRHDAVRAGEQRRQVVPVGVRAPEAVHRDHQLPAVRTAVVDPADRTVEVHRAGLRGGVRGAKGHVSAPSSRPGTGPGSVIVRSRFPALNGCNMTISTRVCGGRQALASATCRLPPLRPLRRTTRRRRPPWRRRPRLPSPRHGRPAARRRPGPRLRLGTSGRRAGRAGRRAPVTELPGFLPPAVAGHAGRVRSVQVGRAAGAGAARPHPPLRGPRRRAGRARGAGGRCAGCRTVVLTNAAGGIREGCRSASRC
jgi:hypothetical protein